MERLLNKVKISERALPAVLAAGVRVRDSSLPLVLVPNKKRDRCSVYFVKREKGQDSAKWLKVGVWPDVSVSVVKVVAKQLLADKALGKPLQQAALDSQYHQFEKYGAVLDWYLADALTAKALSTSRGRNVRTIINKHIKPALADYELSKLCEPVIKNKLVDPLSKAGYAISYIDLICRTTRQVLSAAVRAKVVPVNPLVGMTLRSFTTAKVKPKKAAYHAGQLLTVIAAIRKEPRAWVRVLAGLILLHAMRVDEVAGLAWRENIDDDSGMLRLGADQTKNGQQHLLPLTPQAKLVLRYHKRMQRRNGHRGNWLLPARRNPKRHLNGCYASAIMSECLGLGTAHDLRKIARQWWQENGIDFYVGELLLNHKTGVLSQTYIQTMLVEPCRAALGRWHDELEKLGFMEAVCKE